MRYLRRISVLIATAFLAAALSSASAIATRATTGPGSRLEIYVFIGQQKISLAIYALSDYAGSNETYLEAPQQVTRGDTVLFIVKNKSKEPQQFTLLGEKTPLIKPGGEAHFSAALVHRGAFPYYASASGQTKKLKGSLLVY